MRPRHAVLLAPSKSSRPIQLNYCQYVVRVSSLAATLTTLPASVANKELTVELSPLDATLMKNIGGRVMVRQRRSGFSDSSSNVPTFRHFNSLFIHSCRSLSKECLRTLLKSEASALFLKTAGCTPTIPILELIPECIAAIPALSFHALTNCKFPICFVLISIHVMGGMYAPFLSFHSQLWTVNSPRCLPFAPACRSARIRMERHDT
jgi:hypothetical protein